jgi:hypothetical protein
MCISNRNRALAVDGALEAFPETFLGRNKRLSHTNVTGFSRTFPALEHDTEMAMVYCKNTLTTEGMVHQPRM